MIAYRKAQHPSVNTGSNSSPASVKTAYNTNFGQIPASAHWDLPEGVKPEYSTLNPMVFGGSEATPNHPLSKQQKGEKKD